MQRVESIDALRATLRARRLSGARIAFVPTMGALHEGHLALVDAARRLGDLVVMSIFVNPLQFGPTEDFERYPRDLERDAARAQSRGVDVLFTPTRGDMYPAERAVEVRPLEIGEVWEGRVRPGHFAGVLTVVAKLLNLVQPDIAVFGQKDIQQATLVRAMVRDLNFPVEIVVVPTVRDADGVALSSRNAYLGPDERVLAGAIPRALAAVTEAYAGGERDPQVLQSTGERILEGAGGVAVEYFALMDPVHLRPAESATPGTIVAVAVRIGATRLIDNTILSAP